MEIAGIENWRRFCHFVDTSPFIKFFFCSHNLIEIFRWGHTDDDIHNQQLYMGLTTRTRNNKVSVMGVYVCICVCVCVKGRRLRGSTLQ